MQNTEPDLEKLVKRIVISQLGTHPDKVTNEALFIDDLGADSLDVMDLVMSIEEELDIEIPDYEAVKLTSVGEALKYLKEKRSD